MKILVLAAMHKELTLILEHLTPYTQSVKENITVYSGKMGKNDVIAAQCGIGKVNSALRTLKLIEAYKPDLVINSGVAGGVDPSMKIGSVMVPDAVAYHDVWCGPGTEIGQADGCPLFFKPSENALAIIKKQSKEAETPYRFGLICSGDRFISLPEEVKTIKSNFPEALGCDMESASIAQACYTSGVPFLVIRVMSDMPGGGENISEYENFWSIAPKRTFEALEKLVCEL
jgi:adenosylhomocysteine nucleosidase